MASFRVLEDYRSVQRCPAAQPANRFADDGRVTPAFASVGLFAGTVGVDEPVASLDNAGAVPV